MKPLKRELLRIIFIVIPFALVMTFMILLKYQSSSVLDWPNLYGLFYPVTSDQVGYTFNFDYYIKGLIIHLIIWGGIGYFTARFLDLKLKNKILRRVLIGIVWFGFMTFVLFRILIIDDANIKWDYDKTIKIEEKMLND
jgi:hypothetical protein